MLQLNEMNDVILFNVIFMSSRVVCCDLSKRSRLLVFLCGKATLFSIQNLFASFVQRQGDQNIFLICLLLYG